MSRARTIPKLTGRRIRFDPASQSCFHGPEEFATADSPIAAARFSFPINDPSHNCAIHGLIYNRIFKVTRRGPYFVAARLDSRTDADLSSLWPFPFVLDLDYEVGNGLRLHAALENVGDGPMPFGLGAHPYFHAPLDPRGTRGAMQVQGDIDRHWQLDARLLPDGTMNKPEGRFDVRQPVTLGMEPYDDAYSLDPKRGERVARLIDPQLKMALEVRAAPIFRTLVVYAPPSPNVVALEPYTCGPDAFNLATKGVDAGMLELQPGARFEASLEIRLSAL